MVALLGVTWGGTFMVIELALRGITPFWLSAMRIAFAALLMLVIWMPRGARLFRVPAGRADYVRLAFVSAFSTAVPFMFLSWGQQYTTSGFAGVSMAAVALIVLPLAHFLVPGERMTLRRTAGFLVGFAGVVLLIGGDAFASTGAALETAGRLACLATASCYAVSSIVMRRLPPVDPIGLSTVMLVVGAAIVVTCAFIAEGAPPLPDPATFGWLALLGLVPTAGANLIRVLVIRSAGPVFMSLTNYLVPLCAVLFGWLILSEPLPPSLIGAMALILGGVALSQWDTLRPMILGR